MSAHSLRGASGGGVIHRAWWGRVRLVRWLVALIVLMLANTAWAESVAELAKKLKDSDFRVRTQAALALGSSGKKEAVKPLCGGLDDENDTVRSAAAAGLGKLKKGGVECLNARLKKEESAKVKKMLSKAIRLIEEAAAGPALGSSTKFYLAIGPTQGKDGKKLDQVVRTAMLRVAAGLTGFVIAPENETTAQAKKRLRKHAQVYGYYFEPEVMETDYLDGNLTVTLEVRFFGYPDKSPQGSLSRSMTVPGVASKNPAKEQELVGKLSELAMKEFAKLAAQLD